MEFKIIFYYFFSSVALVSALMIIVAVNPVHSILFLVLVFCNVSGLLLLLKVEFLAILFIVVYVGAIGVLFLFVIMMLPTHGQRPKGEDTFGYLPIGFFVGTALVGELVFVLLQHIGPAGSFQGSSMVMFQPFFWVELSFSLQNIEALGFLIYTECATLFIVAGLILLVAMVGAIVLTMHRRGDLRRQKIYAQVGRDFENAVGLKNLKLK
uniref:NADH-ubiquinone oxidoreductase chain 6 n=1 Tax=Goniomonas avonlea TaxID=1255295 RepID=A0A348G6L3_9CRYP|nr:NADH dehydrogenase subunit 6 [Goniomonas avonlea]